MESIETRRFWAAGDGNGGMDIGEGDLTIAHVLAARDLPKGPYVKTYDPRAVALAFRAAPDLLAALKLAESFMAGFEGDELQDGIDERLATVRAAIAKAEGRAA